MKRYFLLSLLILLFSTVASAVVELQFPSSKIKQGSLESVIMRVDPSTAQSFELQKVRGQTIGETLYVYSVSPLMRKEGGDDFEAEARVVFIKVPETPFLGYKTPAGEIVFSWKDLEVIPTEGAKELIFGEFEIPPRKKVLLWGGILLVLIIAGLAGFRIWKVFQKRKQVRLQKLAVKNDISSVNDYQNVVRVWQNKRNFIREFPHLEQPFKNLEQTLFKYQFKQSQTDTEKNEVMSAWKKFVEETRGGFDGI